MPKGTRLYDYTENDVQTALDAVKDNKLSLNAASKLFKVPRSTLQFRRSPSFTKTTKGPSAALTPQEEQMFVDWILDCYKKGFPKSSLDLCLSVKEYLKQMKRPNMFVDDLPGINWLKNFRKRHPEISSSRPRSDYTYRATEQDIREWFGSVEEILQKQSVSEVLKCSYRVFRGEVTTFILDSQRNEVVAVKEGERGMDADIKEAEAAVTAMVTISASGAMVPPMLVYPYQKIPADLAKEVPETWFVGRSEKGLISAQVFHEYIINAFNVFIDTSDIKGSVVLFVDSHRVRLTQQVSQLCNDLEIILIAMYPDSARLAQHCDLVLSSPIKSGWETEAARWKRNNPSEVLTKRHIAPISAEVLKSANFISPCVDGFRAAGLCPWGAESIDFSKCMSTRNGRDGFDVETTNVLTFDRFCSIIGEGTVDMCRALQQRGINDEGNILFQLWMEFQKPVAKQEPAVLVLGPRFEEREML